jgi:hypothetical protein
MPASTMSTPTSCPGKKLTGKKRNTKHGKGSGSNNAGEES